MQTFHKKWSRIWMRFSGRSPTGRIASYMAALFWPPYKGRGPLARMTPKGYVSHTATIHHPDLQLGQNVFIGDRVMIFQAAAGGRIKIGKGSKVHMGTIIETGSGGTLSIGSDTHIQPRCQFSAYKGSIQIGNGVQIAPYCAFYPYDHGFASDKPIKEQTLESKGDIIVEDDAWIGVGVIVLENVRIGKGAVVGGGAVVTRDVPDYAIAVGTPARVVKMRDKDVLGSDRA